MLKAITFDFWNTLYKSPDDLMLYQLRVNNFKSVINYYSYNKNEDEIKLAFNECWEYAHEKLMNDGIDITPAGQIDFLIDRLNLKLDEAVRERLYRDYTSLLKQYPPEMNNGVAEILPILARKYRLAVICNIGVTPGVILREFMKADGIYDYFAYHVFSDEVGWAKPNIKIFQYTLAKLQVNITEAAHVGDDRTTDIEGAKRAGMTAIWLSTSADEEVQCDYQISDVRELLDLW